MYKICSLEYTVVYLYPQNCSPNFGTGLGHVDSSPVILGRVWHLALSDFSLLYIKFLEQFRYLWRSPRQSLYFED